MIILFDGTPHRPWGRHLAVSDEIPKTPARYRPSPESLSGRVLEVLQWAPRRRSEIASALREPEIRIKSALSELQARGWVTVDQKESKRCFGRATVIAIYRVKAWGER